MWENSGGLQEGISCCGLIVLCGEYLYSILTGSHIALSLYLPSADSALGS